MYKVLPIIIAVLFVVPQLVQAQSTVDKIDSIDHTTWREVYKSELTNFMDEEQAEYEIWRSFRAVDNFLDYYIIAMMNQIVIQIRDEVIKEQEKNPNSHCCAIAVNVFYAMDQLYDGFRVVRVKESVKALLFKDYFSKLTSPDKELRRHGQDRLLPRNSEAYLQTAARKAVGQEMKRLMVEIGNKLQVMQGLQK